MTDREKHPSSFVPLCIGLLTLVVWFGFQAIQLRKERENFATLNINQNTIYSNAEKMRTQLDTIAAELARLAQAGNQNAAQMVDALKQRGITIDPSKAKSADK